MFYNAGCSYGIKHFCLRFLPSQVLCVHGGLSPDVRTIDQVSLCSFKWWPVFLLSYTFSYSTHYMTIHVHQFLNVKREKIYECGIYLCLIQIISCKLSKLSCAFQKLISGNWKGLIWSSHRKQLDSKRQCMCMLVLEFLHIRGLNLFKCSAVFYGRETPETTLTWPIICLFCILI